MKVLFYRLTFLLSLTLYSILLSAESKVINKSSSFFLFEENRNQWPGQVKFQVGIPNGSLFLENNTLTYHLTESKDYHEGVHHHGEKDVVKVKHHAWKVKFENSSSHVKITGEYLRDGVRNYYRGNDPSSWASDVHLFGMAKYHNIYDNIDIEFYEHEQNLKYDFIIKPGGNYTNIKMSYEGISEMHLEHGHLYLQTNIGVVVEQKPYAYQMIDGEKKEVACSYKLDDKNLSFVLGANYNRYLPLIIDPVLIASTYTGSTADNFGFTATYDNAGNIYTAGNVFGVGYPATTGAFDQTFNGGEFDISISKFNPTGTTLLYATYYGGNEDDQPHSLIVNSSNELFVTGRSNSPNFPTTTNAYDKTHNGSFDIIVGKFNASGVLVASTFVGGSGADGVNQSEATLSYSLTKYNYADDGRGEIMLDGAGNVFVTSSTQSSNFPTSNAYDATLSGTQDACVFKMNNTLSALSFSTYLGGSSVDAGYGIRIDNAGNIYVTGGTASNNFPTTAGVIHSAFQGGDTDGFISVFNSTGSTLATSTYLGTNAYDQSYFIDLDINNNVYVFGQTMGAYPVTAGTYSNAGSAQFIHKMNSSLTTTVFSTVFGSGELNPNISPTAFMVDSCEIIYASGWGRCSYFGHPNSNTTDGLPITPNAIQTTTDGCDFYLITLKPDAKGLYYATYFGENGVNDHVDGGTSRFDKTGQVYQSVCASCGGKDNFPVTPGAYSSTNNSSNCNNAVFKIDMSITIEAIASLNGPNIGCTPFTVPMTNTGSIGAAYEWDFGDGSPHVFQFAPTHTYTVSGTYTIILTVSDTLGLCVYKDTASLKVTATQSPVLVTTPKDILCFGQNNGEASVSATQGTPGYAYLWNTGSTTSAASGLSPGTYTVVVTDVIGCTSTQTVVITEPPALALTTSAIPTCGFNNGSTTAMPSGGTPGYSYLWNNGQTTSTATGLAVGNYSVVIADINGCTATSTVTVQSMPGPTAVASNDTSICEGNSSALNASGGGSYLWFPAGNLSSSTISNPVATPTSTTTYTIVVTDANGCTDDDQVTINVDPLPKIAFSAPVVCPNSPTCFIDQTTLGAGSISTWDWNFGDPSSGSSNNSTIQNPCHTYSSTGTYSVSLNVMSSKGCQSSLTNTIVVDRLPVAAFSVDTICEKSKTLFTNSSTNSTSWDWSFGDGGKSTVENPSYTYLNYGTYSVTLIAISSGGCKDTTYGTATVNPAPLVNCFADSVCFNDTNAFSGTATIPLGAISTWHWDFDNPASGINNTSTLQNPTHVFTAPGTYSVNLTVTSAMGCTGNQTVIAEVYSYPKANFEIYPGEAIQASDIAQFTDLSTGGAVSWMWWFGDGNTSTAQNPSHAYADTGVYFITLAVVNAHGCPDTIRLPIEVREFSFYIPNTFTPNKDGKNETFFGVGVGIVEYTLSIFDRWGNKIFICEVKDLPQAQPCRWNGEVKDIGADMNGKSGILSQEDTYVWKVKFKNIFDKYYTYVGHVNIVR